MTDSVVIYGNYHHGLHRGSITMYKSKFVWMSKTVYIERSNFFRPEKQRETVMAVANIYKHLLYTIYTKKTISQNRSKIDYVPLLALRPGWEEEPNSPEEPNQVAGQDAELHRDWRIIHHRQSPPDFHAVDNDSWQQRAQSSHNLLAGKPVKEAVHREEARVDCRVEQWLVEHCHGDGFPRPCWHVRAPIFALTHSFCLSFGKL